jgi:predicted HTH domain antitoxin
MRLCLGEPNMTVNDPTITPQQGLDLARQLAPDQRRWLVATIQEELDEDLPDHAAVEDAIELYLADRCSLARAAELAGITQWAFKRLLAERGTPARAGNDYAGVEALDRQAEAAWARIDGR